MPKLERDVMKSMKPLFYKRYADDVYRGRKKTSMIFIS